MTDNIDYFSDKPAQKYRKEAICWLLAAQFKNNHTLTILIESLLGPLHLASYWLTVAS